MWLVRSRRTSCWHKRYPLRPKGPEGNRTVALPKFHRHKMGCGPVLPFEKRRGTPRVESKALSHRS